MTVTFISDLRDMTYKHYLNQPKPVIECKLNKKLSKNPELIKSAIEDPFLRSYPLIRKHDHLFIHDVDDGEN